MPKGIPFFVMQAVEPLPPRCTVFSRYAARCKPAVLKNGSCKQKPDPS
jgi:hypothetical protein